MKRIHLLTAIFLVTLFTMNCKNSNNIPTTSQTAELSADEKQMIQKEISAKIEVIIEGAKNLDAAAAIKPYSNNSSFMIVNPDASVTGYEGMLKGQTAAFSTVSSMSFKTTKQDFTFLTNDIVICTWTGVNEFELKSGEKMKIDPYVGTMIFKKKDNDWKIIYAHESTAAPIVIK